MRANYNSGSNVDAKSLSGNILTASSLDARICAAANESDALNSFAFSALHESTEKNFAGAVAVSIHPERVLNDLHGCAWTYAQKTGELQHDSEHVSTGYSGAGAGKNNPAMENVANVGPIPRGDWTISGPPTNTKDHGPYVLRLEPAPHTETFGRSGFLMHGDSKESPGCASHGCVILPRAVREEVWKSGDRELEVVSEIPEDTEGNG